MWNKSIQFNAHEKENIINQKLQRSQNNNRRSRKGNIKLGDCASLLRPIAATTFAHSRCLENTWEFGIGCYDP